MNFEIPTGDFKQMSQRVISQKKKEKVVSMLVQEGMLCKKVENLTKKP